MAAAYSLMRGDVRASELTLKGSEREVSEEPNLAASKPAVA